MPKKKKSVRKKSTKRKTIKRRVVRKKVVKKRVAKKVIAKKKILAKKLKGEEIIGVVTHYFPQVRAAVVKLKTPLKIGDTIKIKGHTTDFTQTVTSLQINHVPINEAKKGQEIGLLVDSRVRQRDIVYKA